MHGDIKEKMPIGMNPMNASGAPEMTVKWEDGTALAF